MIVDQRSLDLDQIDPNPWQARKEEDAAHIAELAQSILDVGLMQVPTGRAKDGRVQLAFGHSRLAAFRLLVNQGHDEYSLFPVNIKTLNDEQMAVAAFSENEKRKDLNPVDRANAIQKMLTDFGWTHQDVAEKLGIDRSSVTNSLRMLRMPAEVLTAIEQGILPMRSAMALLPYYELTPAELSILESKDPNAAESISVARSGMLTSDVIRKMVDGMIELVRPSPKPLQTGVTPEPVGIDRIQAVSQEKHAELHGQESSSEGGYISFGPEATEFAKKLETEVAGQEETADDKEEEPIYDGNNVDEDSVFNEEAEKQEKASEAKPKTSKVTQPSKPTPTIAKPSSEPASQPAPVSAVLEGETLLTVKWMTNGVMVGLQKFGQSPTMRFVKELHAADIPFLLKELGIE